MITTIDNITLNVSLDNFNENIVKVNIIGDDLLIIKINKELDIFYKMKEHFISDINNDSGIIHDKVKQSLIDIYYESKLTNMELKYESTITALQKELEYNKAIFTKEIETIKNEFDHKLESHNHINHSKYITEIEVLKATHQQDIEKFTNYNELHSIISTKYNSSIQKGDKGENEIKFYLNEFAKFNNDLIITDTSGMKDHGDLAVKYKEINVSIEIKNYKTNIPNKEVEKFYKSVNKHEYDFGIFISLNSGYAHNVNIKPIDLINKDGKLIIFLSYINDSNKNSLMFAIQLFYQYYLLKKDNTLGDTTKYITFIKSQLQDLDDLIQDLDKFKQMIAKLETKISKMKNNILITV
jgi:hypothetical protein